jgi:hypothetical protein
MKIRAQRIARGSNELFLLTWKPEFGSYTAEQFNELKIILRRDGSRAEYKDKKLDESKVLFLNQLDGWQWDKK